MLKFSVPLLPKHSHVVCLAAKRHPAASGWGEASRGYRRHVACRYNLPRQVNPGTGHPRWCVRHFSIADRLFSLSKKTTERGDVSLVFFRTARKSHSDTHLLPTFTVSEGLRSSKMFDDRFKVLKQRVTVNKGSQLHCAKKKIRCSVPIF
jgi:hypothetical protein